MSKFARRRRPSGRPASSPARRRPAFAFEQLEARDTPATFTWTGLGADNRWATPENWELGVAPTGNPAAVEDLAFPAGAARLTTQNDLLGAVFNSITYGGSNYRLTGNPLTLGIPGVVGSGAVVVNDGATGNVLNINTTLGASGGIDQTFSVNAGADLTVTARLSGTTGSTLTKDGTGTLVLGNDNSGFTGPVRVDDNSGRLVIGHRFALGSTSAPTTVGTNSTLGLLNVSGAINETLRLNGPGAANDGALNNLAGNSLWAGPIILDSNAAVGAAADVLIITGQISDAGAGHDLSKEGVAEVRLNTAGATGNTYRGQTFVNNGVLTVGHPRALGVAGSPANGTVVNKTLTGAGQLRLADPTGFGLTVIDEALTLNGPGPRPVDVLARPIDRGFPNPGALQNTQANNTWAGPVVLGSPSPNGTDVWVGAAAGTDLTITGRVSSPNGAYTLTKVDFGRVVLANSNTYTGTTYVAEGTLTGRDSAALGTSGATGAEVQALHVLTFTGSVTLRVFTFPFDVTFPANISAADLEIALNALPTIGGAGGRVSVRATPLFADPRGTGFGPVGTRFVIHFGGALAGTNVPQMQVISPPGVSTYTLMDGGRAGAVVDDRATLEFGVEAGDPGLPRFDAQGRDLWDDSVTRDAHRLRVDEPVTLYGRGFRGVGALRNVTGINELVSPVALGSSALSVASIGSEPDPRPGYPTPNASYFVNDYSLTVSGVISGGDNVEFKKRGQGHLILPGANTYTGPTSIEEGWVTAQNDTALGVRVDRLGQTAQPRTVVSNGAALHLRSLTGDALTVNEPLTLTGVGPAHPYSLIGGRGALVNLAGNNTLTADMALKGMAGVGVEQIAGSAFSELSVAGSVVSAPNTVTRTWNGGTQEEQGFVFETGTTSGTISVTWDFGPPFPFDFPDRLTAYYPPREPGPRALIPGSDTGVYVGAGSYTLTYGPGSSTQVELVVNEGNKPDRDYLTPFLNPDFWTFTVTLPNVPDGVIKFGSGRLSLQGDGTYDGDNSVVSGTLRLQHDTALGRVSSGTYETQETFARTVTAVAPAAVVEFAETVPPLNGGVRAGIQVWNEQLVLNDPGQQLAIAGAGGTFTLTYRGQTTAPLPITASGADVAAALNALPNIVADIGSVTATRAGHIVTVVFGSIPSRSVPQLVATTAGGAEVVVSGGSASVVGLAGDHAWRGPVSLLRGNRVDAGADTRVSFLGPIEDAGNPAGSDLAKRGPGELLLGGDNSYRGLTTIDEGTLTAMSGTAFGGTDGGTVVADGAQLQLQGSLTVSGEALTVRGTGPAAAQNIPARWFSTGPGPTNNGVAPLNLPTSGRITGTAVDPTDPNVIYVATAGGGAFKTKDGGRTWLPLFDQNAHPAGVPGDALLYGGSFAISPTRPQTVYFATGESNGPDSRKGIFDSFAGSGVYKSTDAGATWTLLYGPGDDNPIAGQAVGKVLVDTTNPDIVYAATSSRSDVVANLRTGRQYRVTFVGGLGASDQPLLTADDTGGLEVFTSTVRNGRIGGPSPPTPPRPPIDEQQLVKVFGNNGTFTLTFRGQTTAPIPLGATDAAVQTALNALSTIAGAAVVSPLSPDDAVATPTPGVWRFSGDPGSGGEWANLIDVEHVSDARKQPGGVPGQAPYDAEPNGVGPPGTPGPDDDYRVTFPQDNASWSDLFMMGGVLYAALGESDQQHFVPPITTGSFPVQQAVRNGVYKTNNPRDDRPRWAMGPLGAIDTRPGGQAQFPIGTVETPLGQRNGYIKVAGGLTIEFNPFIPPRPVIWAVVTQPFSPNQLLDFQYSLDGGGNWTAVTTLPPNLFGPPGQQQGRYDIAIEYDPTIAPDRPDGTVYVAGRDRIFFSIDNGQTWTNLNPDLRGGGPARFFHDLEWVPGTRDIVSASDGGVWRYVFNTGNFQDLNGTLTATQFFSADAHPTDLTKALAGARNNGTQRFNNSTAWERVDDAVATETTAVRYDTRTPRTAYAVRNGQLRKTVDGGSSWTAVPGGGSAAGLVVDAVNPARILIGGATVRESVSGGAGLTNLNAPVTAGRPATAVAAASYQGPFVPDPDFPLVTDVLSNTYNPATIYVTDGQSVFLTKNRGVSWTTRTPPGAAGGTITDVAVDPANRDTVYVAVSRPSGAAGGRVFRSTDAGRTWADISGLVDPAGPDAGPLPAVPTWKLAIDPRPQGTAVYVGNDAGVWRLTGARTADPAALVWNRLGAGMPQVGVRDIVVNQTLNTLTAATYGRGMFQLLLTDPEAASGAVRAVSGSSEWVGPVTLTGPTTIGAAGSQNLQNGITPASLNINGPVAGDAAATLTKIGRGTLTLSGTNTYAGQTDVAVGVLEVNNPRALGAANLANPADTVIRDGAVLEVRADIELEPITAFGRGLLFNDHFTGSVRNVSNDNVYTGTLTLATDGTIGVDSGTSLTIGQRPGVLAGVGTLTDGGSTFALDKELPGTLILASANTYDGLTRVVAGALQVQDGDALGSPAAGTVVLDGAQLQVARNTATGLNTVVPSEPLTLSGTGINRSGALQGGAGDNAYAGPILFDFLPNFSPPTSPASQVAIGTAGAADNLTIDTSIGIAPGVAAATFGLAKVGAGRVTLARANNYPGVTTVEAGTLRVQNNQALGTAGTNAGSPEVQTVTVFGTAGTFTLGFDGQTTAPIAVGASAADVQAALVALPNIAAGDVFVLKADITGGAVYTVFFTGTLAGTDVSQLVGLPAANPAVSVATVRNFGLGTVVSAGATLELDGSTGAGPLTLNEVLTINGDGVGGQGAVRSVLGTNTYAAPITLGSDASVGAADGAVLRVTGAVQDPTPAAVPASRLRKGGAGVVELTAANPYAGLTVVDDGILRITNRLALGSTGPEVQSVLVLGTSGTFTLTFNGATTVPLAFDVPASGGVSPADSLQNALNALPSVGGVGGSVTVTRAAEAGGFRYTITFGGVLGTSDLPQVVADVTGGTVAFPRTDREGPSGTLVNPGGTLQVAGGLVFDREALTIRGNGFGGIGALNSDGSNTWDTPITLAGNAAVGTTNPGDVLTLTRPTTDEGNRFNLDIVGPGTVAYTATVDNQYTGTTTVRSGTLRLDQPSGLALVGPAVVGGGTVPALLVEARGNQIGDATPVTVKRNGTFDLNGQSDVVGTVTVNDGTVRTGPGGRLTLPNSSTAVPPQVGLNLTGGTVEIGAGGRVVLNGNVIATSSALGAASILGPGTLDLNGTDRTVNVADGPAADDLRVSAQLATPGTARVLKDGAGRLTFFPATATTVPVTVRNGDVQVDTVIGPVELGGAAASLSGAGTVGSLRGAGGAANPAVGTVSPGNPADPAGILRAGTTRWGSQTVFAVTLDSSGASPVPGDDYDQLAVSGAITLGGATLTGTVGSGVELGNEFVIVTATGGVTGRFAEPAGPGIVFLNGQKFTVRYEPTEVVLSKVLADVSVEVTSSANPSTRNQPVTFTATVTPEAGAAGADLSGSVVRFIIDGAAVADVPVTGTTATYTTSTLGDGPHTVSVQFIGDGVNFGSASDDLDAPQVVETPAISDLTGGEAFISPDNSPGVLDAFTASATVTEERARTTFTVTVTDSGGTVVRTFTGSFFGNGEVPPVNTFPINVLWDGKDDAGNVVPDGTYAVSVRFEDEFTNAGTAPGVTVVLDNTSPVLGGVTVPNRRVSPGTAVRVLDATITEPNLTGWTVTVRDSGGNVVRTFTGTGTTVAVDFDGTNGSGTPLPDGFYTLTLTADDAAGNSTTTAVPGTVLVLAAEATIDALAAAPAFASPNNSIGLQDAVALTTAVRQVTAPTATWTVTIRDGGGNVVRTFTQPAVIDTASQTFPIAVTWDGRTETGAFVADGVYTATASFTDAFGQTGTTAPASFTIDNTSPAAGAVSSSVRFIAPGTTGTVPTSTTLTASITDANLTGWTLTVRNAGGTAVRTFTGTGPAVAVTFDGRDGAGVVLPDGTYTAEVTARDAAGNTATGAAGSVTVITRPPVITLFSNSPTTYGQSITLTATVAVPAGVTDLLAGVPVEFARGGEVLGSAPLAAGDDGVFRASITVPTFAAGTYTDLTAATAGTDVFLPGLSAPATHTVMPAVLNVQANDATTVYGRAVPPLTYTVSGLVNGDTAGAVLTGGLATTATPASPVGAYPITRGSVASNGNYVVNFTPGTLSVTPAPLVVRASDASRVVGTPNPPFTASYEGLVNGDTPAVVNGLVLSTPATIDSRVGLYPVVAGGNPTAANYTVSTANGTLSVVPAPTDVLVGAGRGTPAGANLYNPDGTLKAGLNPFPGFAGGVRTALADFNRDGVADPVLGTGPGTTARFVILDGASGTEIFSAAPFGDFTGGLFVAAGDVDGDGQADLVVTPDEGGGPRVIMYRGGDFDPVLSYFGIDDPNFRGGARAAVGDLNADGFADIAVSAGFGGGPRISIWDGQGLAAGRFRTLTSDFFAFAPDLRNGTYSAIGDVNGDGFGDLVVGAGPGGGPRVTVLDGRTLLTRGPAAALAAPMANFFAGNVANRGGVRVAVKYLDGDLNADVVTGPGDGDRSVATAYRGSSLVTNTTDPLFDLPGFNDLNGVYVG
ncbi:MAG: autotransporter-associated beta strand repeat-containing protein [Gemmataceae bacterium]|nr:autotransporter-associated beta strand repeat-containing protein [Gemmataceae bacterium]